MAATQKSITLGDGTTTLVDVTVNGSVSATSFSISSISIKAENISLTEIDDATTVDGWFTTS